MKRSFLIVLLPVGLCLLASAQRFDASIRGTVSDQSGSPAAEAVVIAVNTETGLRCGARSPAGVVGDQADILRIHQICPVTDCGQDRVELIRHSDHNRRRVANSSPTADKPFPRTRYPNQKVQPSGDYNHLEIRII